VPTTYLKAWNEPDAPRPAPFPDQLRLVSQWRRGIPDGLDRTNRWAGQSAALSTTDPAGEVIDRMWRDASALLA
jgi:nitronate monooxygenase